MSRVEFKPEETKKRIAKLKDYYDEHFKVCTNGCKNFEKCSNGFKKELVLRESFNDSIRVGKYYDTYVDGNPLRLLIVGIEVISKTGRTFEQKNKRPFRLNECHNNHIVGTLETLLRIYGVDVNVQKNWKEHISVKNDLLYDSYALTNAFKCVFKTKENGDNKAGPKNRMMYDKCYEHLISELNILDPTIIITQGRWSDNYNNLLIETLKGSFAFIKKIDEAAASGYDNLGLYEFEFNSHPMYVLLSLHPARIRYNDEKLKVVLNDQLEYLRMLKIIPQISVLKDYIHVHGNESI